MIPLRHGLIVKEHGKLTYPEGTACADVLIVGEQGGTTAKTVFIGFFVGPRLRLDESDPEALVRHRDVRRGLLGQTARRHARVRSVAGDARRRLHHRAEDGGEHDGRRRARVSRARAAHPHLRRRGTERDLSGDDAHRRSDSGRDPQPLHSLHRRGRGRDRRLHRAGARAPHDRGCIRPRREEPAHRRRRARRRAHRARSAHVGRPRRIRRDRHRHRLRPDPRGQSRCPRC